MECDRGALQFRKLWHIEDAITGVNCAVRDYNGPDDYEVALQWQALRDYLSVVEASLCAYIEQEAEHGERA